MSRNGLSNWSLPIGLSAAGVIKTAVGYGGFSGRDAPPMFGDFEAQRHWMEITLHRPMKEWYTYAPDWWLLDYPPLTAYASWLCGKIGSALNPVNFALDTSYGLSPPDLITFMRFSVLSFEACIWWSAVMAWMLLQGKKEGRSWRSQMTGIMTILLQPSLTLIDNGHFQYNSVLLGFSLWTLVFLTHDQDLLACVAFSCALCFKQMGLYYAPAIGCYLIGKCIWLGGSAGLLLLVKLGIVTVATFGLLFAPWLRPFPEAILQVLHRMFPFARGIFEDKVANFWCASNVVIKWRRWFGINGMAKLATVATLASLIPLVLILLYTSFNTEPESRSSSVASRTVPVLETPRQSGPPPSIRLLPMALFSGSLAFFLFSFQVHEKSILLPLMPLTVLMAFRGGKEASASEDETWEVGVLLNNVAVFSMWPLLKRDGQALQYVFVTLLWNYVIGYSPTGTQPTFLRLSTYLIYLCIAVLHLPDLFPTAVLAPGRFPDLFIVLNVLLSFGVFGLAWLWSLKRMFEIAWAIAGSSIDPRDHHRSTRRAKVD
ncbi:glucosyltransferase [Kockovaella imperatae]|uniref:Alpha-1,3-glucosyltransferase n=1 Tax=Kockovaella imperatae TaxID=4999 RepID=A0A1Y1UD21_9TREE|nr:glucosyltransferase [Kockovaella imperatae]ORX35940.1 glucosyltransferase [Kockovaella imperatae]